MQWARVAHWSVGRLLPLTGDTFSRCDVYISLITCISKHCISHIVACSAISSFAWLHLAVSQPLACCGVETGKRAQIQDLKSSGHKQWPTHCVSECLRTPHPDGAASFHHCSSTCYCSNTATASPGKQPPPHHGQIINVLRGTIKCLQQQPRLRGKVCSKGVRPGLICCRFTLCYATGTFHVQACTPRLPVSLALWQHWHQRAYPVVLGVRVLQPVCSSRTH